MGMSPEDQAAMMAQQEQGPVDGAAPPLMGEPGMMPPMGGEEAPFDPAMFEQQYMDMDPAMLAQMYGQNDASAMMQPGMDQMQPETPDPVTEAMILSFDMYTQILQDQQLNLDVRAKAAYTVAQSIKLLSDVQNVGAEQQQEQGLDPELQFQMEMQKMEMQIQAEQQRLQMDMQRLQMELEFKQAEAELKLQLQREQADIKMQQMQQQAQMDMDRKQDEHILTMAQKEDEVNVQSTGSVPREDV